MGVTVDSNSFIKLYSFNKLQVTITFRGTLNQRSRDSLPQTKFHGHPDPNPGFRGTLHQQRITCNSCFWAVVFMLFNYISDTLDQPTGLRDNIRHTSLLRWGLIYTGIYFKYFQWYKRTDNVVSSELPFNKLNNLIF